MEQWFVEIEFIGKRELVLIFRFIRLFSFVGVFRFVWLFSFVHVAGVVRVFNRLFDDTLVRKSIRK